MTSVPSATYLSTKVAASATTTATAFQVGLLTMLVQRLILALNDHGPRNQLGSGYWPAFERIPPIFIYPLLSYLLLSYSSSAGFRAKNWEAAHSLHQSATTHTGSAPP